MKGIYYSIFLLGTLIASLNCTKVKRERPFLSNLQAGQHFPLYTTYASAMERSSFLLDEGYQLQYDVDSLGVGFITDKAGDVGWAFGKDRDWVYRTNEMFKKPVITVSYPDLVVYHYYPFQHLRVDISLVVHSSVAAFWKVKLTNEGEKETPIKAAPFIKRDKQKFTDIKAVVDQGKVYFSHIEEPDRWSANHHIPYIDSIADLYQVTGGFNKVAISDGDVFNEHIFERNQLSDSGHLIAFRKTYTLEPHESDSFRVFRIVQPLKNARKTLDSIVDSLKGRSVGQYISANEKLFDQVPPPPFEDTNTKALYWSACNMMRQMFYKPQGNLSYNCYVFSREPQWGWGHGGQVFHESITMLAYAHIDPQSAMNSMRVFAERQHPNGYINYRTGPYLDEMIEYKGELTSSAPWYAWLNWEVYKITKDTNFLKEMYPSAKRFYNFYTSHRDKDHDGLCEWGGEAVLESVRDALVAVWDQVGYPSEFEALDLNCMLVMEAKALEKMAEVLHLPQEAEHWKTDYMRRAALANKTFWDPATQFYYNVDKQTHSFTHKKKDDLKRKEIIGFLPLWAGIADSTQAAMLVRHLTDTASFWRPYGVPSLAADDPYYDPQGYWNGPVWIQWNYLIERGLLDYGYKKVAGELVKKVTENMIAVLASDHTLWEFYDPDSTWGGYHHAYIWAGIVNRMMRDVSPSER